MQKQNIDQNFSCLICTQLATDAVETLCCGQILCDKCAKDLFEKEYKACPNCRQDMKVKASMIARRLISTFKIECVNGCGQKIDHKDTKNHEKICPFRTIECIDCQDKEPIRILHLIDHMKEKHQKKLLLICIKYLDRQVFNEDIFEQSSKTKLIGIQSSIRSKGKQMRQGTSGKYYCGQKNLIGKCTCCDGNCGPTDGENCDDCMEADMKRLCLPKGFLITPGGKVCKKDEKTKRFSCGRMYKKEFCTSERPCYECERVNNSILLGRYKNLIS